MNRKILSFILGLSISAAVAFGAAGCGGNGNNSGDNGGGGGGGNQQTPETDNGVPYGNDVTFVGVSPSNTAAAAASLYASALDGNKDATFEKLRNEKFFAHIQLNNPKHYVIRSVYLTYAGKETPYAAYCFNESTGWNDIYIQLPAIGAEDISEYRVTKITYLDNTGKKFVVRLGEKDSFNISVKDIRTEEILSRDTFTLTGNVYSMTKYDPEYLDGNGKYVIPSEHNGKPVAEVGEYAFAYCEDIKELVIPDSIETLREGAFYDCLNLEKVEMGTSEATKLFISYKNAFYGCEKIDYVNYNGTLEKWMNIRFGRTEAEQEQAPNVPNWDNKQEYRQSNPTTHSWDLHIKGELLTEVIVPESVNVVRDFTFSRCQSIERVVIHDGVNKIGYGSFLTNSGIRSLDLGNGVETIAANAFNGCYQLSELVLPESLINLLGTGGNSPFKACDKLFKVSNNSQVDNTVVLNVLGTIDKSLFSINGQRVDGQGQPEQAMTNEYERDNQGFVWMKNSLREGVYFLQGYEGTAEEVTLPTEYKGLPVELGACIFACNRTVKKIVVPEGFTHISNRFAASALALEEVVMPESLQYVGNHAFWHCVNLKSVNIPAGCAAFDSSAFDTGAKDFTVTINSTQINYAGSSLKAQKLTVNFAGTVAQFKSATQNEMGVSKVYGNCKVLARCSDGNYDPAED